MSIVEKAAERLRRQNAEAEREAAARNEQANEFPDAPDTLAVSDDGMPKPTGHRRHITLDESRLRRRGLMPPESMDLFLTREFQRIKRPLLAHIAADDRGAGAPASRLMVTSANPGEGKSFTAFNLALSLANEMDHSVVLIDGDVAKPGISRGLDLENEPGLLHLLKENDASAEDYLLATDEPRLSILPSGRRTRGAVERLASRRMAAVLDELGAEPSRILIMDSAPLLAAAESQALAVNAGQILMVVRSGKTEQRAVTSALSLIEPAGAEISFVLNQAHQLYDDRHAGYYGVYPGDADRME